MPDDQARLNRILPAHDVEVGATDRGQRHADHQVYLAGLGTSDWTRLLAGVFQSVSRHEAWQARQQAECCGSADEAPSGEWLER